MSGQFYGHEWSDAVRSNMPGHPTPGELYQSLLRLWSRETCAPRLREGWTPENPTWGQCSITAFLVQDIFGGEVYGIDRGGSFHCYNAICGYCYDLTSEQFGTEKLSYEGNPLQDRQVHFSKEEKYQRYLMLKHVLMDAWKWTEKDFAEKGSSGSRILEDTTVII